MEVLQFYVKPNNNGNSKILFLAIVDGAIVDSYDPDGDWIKPDWAKRLSVQVTVSAAEYKLHKQMADAIREANPCGYVESKGSSARGQQR